MIMSVNCMICPWIPRLVESLKRLQRAVKDLTGMCDALTHEAALHYMPVHTLQ